MGDAMYLGVMGALVVLGAWRGSWTWVAGGLLLWVAVVAVIALTGGFKETGENNSLGVFVFTALPGLAWVGAIALGVALRRAMPPRGRRTLSQ